MTHHPAFRGLAIAAIIAVIALIALLYLRPTAPDNTMGPIGVSYTLTDQNGQKFASASLKNHYQLVYFGFTFCPDICPVELQKMTDAMRMADIPTGKLTPVFISIDPMRDTAAVLKAYLANFHPDFIGLTGTEAEIDSVIAGYKVYASKINDPKYSEYMMDHSSFIYLIAPDGNLLKLYSKTDTADAIAADLKAFVR